MLWLQLGECRGRRTWSESEPPTPSAVGTKNDVRSKNKESGRRESGPANNNPDWIISEMVERERERIKRERERGGKE